MVIYTGKDDEDYVETRIRLYKSKSSMPLPPDPDSVVQVITRAHYQAYGWYPCGQQTINHLDLEECGWTIQERDVTPVWFIGDQFQPSAHNAHSKSEKARDGSVADDESSESQQWPPAKKARTLALGRKRKKRPSLDHLP